MAEAVRGLVCCSLFHDGVAAVVAFCEFAKREGPGPFSRHLDASRRNPQTQFGLRDPTLGNPDKTGVQSVQAVCEVVGIRVLV